jgi:hypothetical protein
VADQVRGRAGNAEGAHPFPVLLAVIHIKFFIFLVPIGHLFNTTSQNQTLVLSRYPKISDYKNKIFYSFAEKNFLQNQLCLTYMQGM